MCVQPEINMFGPKLCRNSELSNEHSTSAKDSDSLEPLSVLQSYILLTSLNNQIYEFRIPNIYN